MDKKQWITGGLSLGLLLVIFFMGYFHYTKTDECLKNSSSETVGRVDEIIYYKRKRVKFSFMVHGKRYSAIQGAGQSVRVGDKFYIHYCEEDPSMNRILFDRQIYD